ncbi:LSU ribosomal protein L17P [Chthoniobacter flavus]|uniref:50S ribosomal protein L17 n=1 Tax=Chthoniobacter flavus TaxID=191863 RepID=UPI0010447F76|nr:LSU ribosomal protein L17P [Chthoniobacter flavus]
MRHQRKTVKLGRKEGHRKSLLSNLAVSLIEHNRIKTTLAKAKALRPLAEKLVTIGKKNTIHARRTAKAVLRQDEAVTKLFAEIAPRAANRKGGYTRIIKLPQRLSDAAEVAFIEWVDAPVLVETATPEPKPAKKAAAKKSEPKAEAKKEEAPAAEGEKPAKKPRAKKSDEKAAE